MNDQSFVTTDGEDADAASGKALAETKALLELEGSGAAHVTVRDGGDNKLEFDREDGICGVQYVDRTEIRAASEGGEGNAFGTRSRIMIDSVFFLSAINTHPRFFFLPAI
jgi:hypothetical protein